MYLSRPKDRRGMKRFFLLLGMSILVASCGDDDGPGGIQVATTTLAEQIVEDDAAILDYLDTHFYNYEEFQNPPENFNFRVRIDSITGDNSDKIPLSQQVSSAVINVSSNETTFPLPEEETDVLHTYYFLQIREGQGPSPTIGDSTLVKYEGQLLNGFVFDDSADFVWFPLYDSVRGFANSMAQMKGGTPEGIVINPDGTSQITDSGMGLMIIPSGLAYFNRPREGSQIPLFAPLVFTFELGLTVEDTDTDNDGIPNMEEDLDGDGFLFDDNTDLEGEIERRLRIAFPNFRDPDDDGDGVLTRDEISDENGNIIFPYPDTDNDGTPDYLDSNILREPGN